MSHPDFLSTLRSSDHELITALRFLEEYVRSAHECSRHDQVSRNFVPRFDLEQHEGVYELYGELPGFRREDVVIEANDERTLQVSGSVSRLTSHPTPPTGMRNGSKNSEDPAAAQPQDAPLGSDPAKATTAQERYLDGRFGDVLNPHAGFVGANGDAKGGSEVSNGTPKVGYMITERHPTSFHRVFHFPTPIEKGEIMAVMQDGILHITARRAPMPPPFKVQIRDEPGRHPAVLT